MKKILALAFAAGIIALLGYRIIEARNKAKPAAEAERVFTVKTLTVAVSDVPHVVLITGNIQPKNIVDIAPKIGGRVERIVADLGDRVQAGGALAIVEHREISLQVQQAEAGAAMARVAAQNAKSDYDRAAKLQDTGAMSESQLDGLRTRMEAAKAQLAQAEAAVGLAREALRNATLSSPIAGYVTSRRVEIGQLLGPGYPVYQVQESSVMKFSSGVDAADFSALKKGMPVAVRVDAFPNDTFQGRLARISPALDPYTRRATVEIEIPNRDGRLMGNMFARGMIEIGREKDAIAIPPTAILSVGDTKLAYVTDGKLASKRTLELKFTNDQVAVVKSGMQAGEQLVVQGQELLSDGSKVEVSADAAEQGK
jgi:RND family efflux transporter MFP subunit